MFVACSTLCFGRYPLEETLRVIAELHFSKCDVAIHEHGRQLKPSQVAEDVGAAAARLRYGPGLTPVAFSVDIDAPTPEEYTRQFKAICRLARISAVPVITIKPASQDVALDDEMQRLKGLVQHATTEGVVLTVSTLIGTHTGTPEQAMELCEKVPGLGLTLDPSHYTVGPNQGKNYDDVFPFVQHLHLRDTGRGPNQFQVRIGQGEVEYGRIISQLERFHYNRALSVDIRDIPDMPFAMEPEVRKLKYLLESLV
ncbi:MAG: sugar phosphate isomerase/epimerase [Gemmataceae bacterium]